jgi:hypothetical protein
MAGMQEIGNWLEDFGWDFEDAHKLILQNHFRKKNGPEGAIAQKFNPEVEPFEKNWHMLDQAQKDILLAQFNLFLSQNKKHTRGGLNREIN